MGHSRRFWHVRSMSGYGVISEMPVVLRILPRRSPPSMRHLRRSGLPRALNYSLVRRHRILDLALNIPAQNFDKFCRADWRKSVADQLHTVHQGRIEQIWCDRAKRFRELDQRWRCELYRLRREKK